MRSKVIIAMLVVLFVTANMASARVWDTEAIITGRQPVPYGAAWMNDDQSMYFGTGKDLALTYDSSEDKFYLNDTALYLEEATTFGTSISSPDLTASVLTVNDTATFTRPPAMSVNASTTVANTVFTTSSIKSIIPVDASGNNVTVTLPDAAAAGMTGRIITIKSTVSPVANYVRVNATGDDHIDGDHFIVSTTDYDSVQVFSDGTQYWTVGRNVTTWAAHA